jgi:hypothetical protein
LEKGLDTGGIALEFSGDFMPGPTPSQKILLSAPWQLSWRNLLPTGLAAALQREFRAEVCVVSPDSKSFFEDGRGSSFRNFHVPSRPDQVSLPTPLAVGKIDQGLRLIQQIGFAIEHPGASLALRALGARRDPFWLAAKILTRISSRDSGMRRLFREIYAAYRPCRRCIAEIFDAIRPQFVLVTSPGHYWLDFLLMDEAKRRGIPAVCIVQSWDNLYNRGSMHRRPDYLLVWGPEMRRQAIEVHQFPGERISEVGAVQFSFYAESVSPEEVQRSREAVGLKPAEDFFLYAGGSQTFDYEIEDLLALMGKLRSSRWSHLRVVARPHPKSDRKTYARLREYGVLVDESPDITVTGARLEAFDSRTIRHMQCLLSGAKCVISSWGTTVLLEACVFNMPAIQLRWMDAVPRANPAQVQKVRDFQRYYHMRPFDALGSRLFSDSPDDFLDCMERLIAEEATFKIRRRETLEQLAVLPLDGVVERVVGAIRSFVFF